jgi:hypothetical protein
MKAQIGLLQAMPPPAADKDTSETQQTPARSLPAYPDYMHGKKDRSPRINDIYRGWEKQTFARQQLTGCLQKK